MMKKNKSFKPAFFLAAITLGLNAQKLEKPNILYIMSDDHAAEAIGAYGGRLARLNMTPVLDKLASEGILFTNCFVTNSISTPSRASIITGQYSQTNGILDLNMPLKPENQYLPIEMKKLGYQTAMIGKWHLTEEPAPFDYYSVLRGQGTYFDPVFLTRGEKPFPNNVVKTTGHSTDIIADIGIDWLENKRDKSKPFFLMLHFKAPHDMFQFAPRYKGYLEDVEIPEPASMYYNANNGSEATRGRNDSLIHDIGASVSHRDTTWGLGKRLGIDQRIPDPEYTHLVYQEYLKRYLRCVKGIDDNVGRLIEYLKKKGLYDNTIIMYTSDQGFMLGEHDYTDKRWMYDESIRMPFFVRYPKQTTAGKRTDAIINNTDFAPTIIDLAGGTIPGYMQGHSFKTILETGNEPSNWQQSTYYRYWMHMAHDLGVPAHFGIRTKEYKLIFFYGCYWVDPSDQQFEKLPHAMQIRTPVGWEFYDLKNDPYEMDNRYKDPKYANIIKDLKVELAKKRKELNEEDQKYPHIQKIIEQYWDK